MNVCHSGSKQGKHIPGLVVRILCNIKVWILCQSIEGSVVDKGEHLLLLILCYLCAFSNLSFSLWLSRGTWLGPHSQVGRRE